MEKVKRFLNSNKKGLGLAIILISLLMIFSLILLSFMANPFYLIQTILILPIMGSGFALVFWIIALIYGMYQIGIRFKFFNSRRVLALFLILALTTIFISNIFIQIDINASYSSVGNYFNTTFITPNQKIFKEGNFFLKYNEFDFKYLGFLLPILLWVLGAWGYGILTGIIIGLLIIYFIYVFITSDYQIFIPLLAFWNNDKSGIKTNKKADSIDLNQETKEFELNFKKEVEENKETLELIEKVRGNMDTKNYEELSKKIAEERKKLVDLREKVIEKVKQNNEDNKVKSKMSDAHKKEIMATLGYTSYSKLKMQAEQKQIEAIKINEELNNPIVKEETIEDNIELVNDGYKTTEEAYDVSQTSLSDAFVSEIIEDMSSNYDPTQEVPLLQDYSEIFDNDEELINEINNTLETIVELEEEISNADIEAELIIDKLDEEITVEQYISMPEAIERTQEQRIKTEVVEETTTEQVWEEETVEEEAEALNERPKDWCKPYILPSTSILTSSSSSFDGGSLVEETTQKAKQLNEVFSSFNVKATVNSFEIGPTITLFKIQLESGIKTTKVTNLEDNLKLTLGAEYIRILAPIPGTSFIGIEVPNSTKKPVQFKTVYDEAQSDNSGIQISIGQDVSGKSLSFDLTKAPHLLVAGSTGSGKSVAINTILASILLRYKPTDVQLILVDPKMVEFAPFHGVPHLLAEVITDASNANVALKAMVDEMENRYKSMAENGAKKIEELNEILVSRGENKLPYIVVVIDELADLMMVAAKEVEESIMRITQKARAAGIHMILATQRPSTEIITGTIKSNIPSRMAFTVASSIDSRTILGQVGAEKLIGMGDMLVSLYGQLPFRGQGAYISNEEIEDIAAFTKTQCDANYLFDLEKFSATLQIANSNLVSTNDPMYIAAKDTVIHYQKASTSMLQRHLNIGYNKAANIIETLEAEGVIGPAKGSKPREVLMAV